MTASLYTWNDRDNPIATRSTSNIEGFFDLFYGSVLLSDLLTLHPELDTRDAVPYLLEICDESVCHYSILFPSWFVYRNGNVGGFATINELTTAFYYSVMDRPQGEVLYYLDQYAALVMAGEVPGYEDGTIGYEDIGRLDYHLNPEQVDLVESPTLISIVENSINDGQILSIVNVLTGTAGGGGGGGSGGGGSGNNTGGVTPTAIAETIEENTTLNGSLPANDPDGLPATDAFAVTTPPDHGVLSLNADSGAYAYQPDADFTGADSFRAAVTDV
ncbi:MAG: Ig-like domain-containing protein, partial [Halieaceae bacterium]|nr:Ig-like domain-containing protein [Halieaceae bacterium]